MILFPHPLYINITVPLETESIVVLGTSIVKVHLACFSFPSLWHTLAFFPKCTWHESSLTEGIQSTANRQAIDENGTSALNTICNRHIFG